MDKKLLRNTLGHFASGVTIITAENEGEFLGMTANAFSSLSLEPPLILVCIDKRAKTMKGLEKGKPFVVNILQEKQENECMIFAKSDTNKFEKTFYSLNQHGIPVLEKNLATVECSVENLLDGGDHYIVTGLVLKTEYSIDKDPLVFFRGKFDYSKEKHNISI